MRYLQYELLSVDHSGKLVYYLKVNTTEPLTTTTCTNDQRTNGHLTNNQELKDWSKRTNQVLQSSQLITSRPNWQTSNNIASSSTNQDNDQRLITSTDDSQFTWLWWWRPLRLSRRQSMSLQTVLLRTTLTRTIVIYRLMKAIISALSSLEHHIHKLIC